MIERVLFAWLFVVKLVASNPVPVFPAQQYASQQPPLKTSAPSYYQAIPSQTNPYNQPVTVQNQAPIQGNLDGTIMNELLMSKILRNPCLQKILDPNTKLYNQNGQEIQRQTNTGATPSVVNNYFIVPPEFFELQNNNTEVNSTSVPRIRKSSNKKIKNKTETKSSISEDNKNATVLDVIEKNNNIKLNRRNKTGKKKKKQHIKPVKIGEEHTEMHLEQDSKPQEADIKITKKRKKQEPSRNSELTTKTSTPNDGSKWLNDGRISEHELDNLPVENDARKTRKKKKKESDVIKKEKTDSIFEITEIQENEPLKNKKMKLMSNDTTLETIPETEDRSHLKDIESPVDNSESINLQENNRPTKRVKENRKTRTPKTDKAKTETNKQEQSTTPISDDILKSFSPYMYMGNSFYSNNNYPFNLGQFYQPFTGKNNTRNKKSKGKKSQNAQNEKDVLPNKVEIKLKSKNRHNATTLISSNEKYTDKSKLNSENFTTTVIPFDETSINKVDSETINVKSNNESTKQEITNEKLLKAPTEVEPELMLVLEPPQQDFDVTKANLELGPTVIEDLHEYITPELGSENIVPTIHANGIINDYYPIFYDDAHHDMDENYYLRDLEDNRHFYTTDPGFEEPLNRDRRKYDRYEDYPRSNLDIKNRINFRRTYKLRESDKVKIDINDKKYKTRPYPEKIVKKESLENENDIEDQFQTPPLLDNPDFITTKIEKVYPKTDVDSYEIKNPIYTDSAEQITEHKTYTDPKPMQYDRHINLDFGTDAKETDKNIPNNKPSDKIETVFAKTSVVKYGVAKEKENSSPLPLFENDGEKFYSDGHTTYVLAKSLGHSDDYFW